MVNNGFYQKSCEVETEELEDADADYDSDTSSLFASEAEEEYVAGTIGEESPISNCS
jgi:hypothetical protein